MRLLLVSPDRDLLRCCKALLEAELGETVAVFDGAQALSRLMSGFDLAVFDSSVPRVPADRLVAQARECGVPSLVLTERAVGFSLLMRRPLACGYLAFPFEPGQLIAAVRDTLTAAADRTPLRIDGAEVIPANFALPGGAPLCAGEVRILTALVAGGRVSADAGAYVSALRAKLAHWNDAVQIGYLPGKGYQLVNGNE